VSKKKIASCRAPNETAKDFDAAVEALQHGDVIVFPTETLYGLGADALDGAAVEKIFRLKGRDPNQPIPVLVADSEMLHTLIADISPLALKMTEHFWPGPLTLVLPARQDIPKPLLNASGGVGVRISSQPIARKLVQALGRPLTATSANPAGKEPARTIEAAKNYFSGAVNVFLDGGTLTSKIGSTVVEVTANKIKIIREGDIAASELRRALGEEKFYQ
jgi:L-threonylcarbamoyladenylate synthase